MPLLPKFVHRLFSCTETKPARAVPDHDPDWAVGDLAECIKKGEWLSYCADGNASGPACGDVLTVRRVAIIAHPAIGIPIKVLSFGSYNGCNFSAFAFRKITPRADEAERADNAFIEQFKRTPPSPWPRDDPESQPATPPPPPPPEPKREDA